MQEYNLINFTDLTHEEKLLVFGWRNDERVAKFMKTKQISLEDHLKFIDSLNGDNSKVYFLVMQNKEYVGVADFINITSTSCEFGVYANPDKKGLGATLMQIILDCGFKKFQLKTIYACAFNENEKAINLYTKFGFEIYKKDEKMTYFAKQNMLKS